MQPPRPSGRRVLDRAARNEVQAQSHRRKDFFALGHSIAVPRQRKSTQPARCATNSYVFGTANARDNWHRSRARWKSPTTSISSFKRNILLRREHDINVTLLAVEHGDIVRCQSTGCHHSSFDQECSPRSIVQDRRTQNPAHHGRTTSRAQRQRRCRSQGRRSRHNKATCSPRSTPSTTSGQVVKVEGTDLHSSEKDVRT